MNSIKSVIQAAESIQQGEDDKAATEAEGEGEEMEFDVVQDMKTANKALQAIFMCSRQPIAQDVFLQNAKVCNVFVLMIFIISFCLVIILLLSLILVFAPLMFKQGLLEAINQLMMISKTQGFGMEDRLKEDTTGVMNASKLLLREYPSFFLVQHSSFPLFEYFFSSHSFDDKSYHARFQEAMKQLQASLKAFLFACAKSKDGKVLEKVAISSVCCMWWWMVMNGDFGLFIAFIYTIGIACPQRYE